MELIDRLIGAQIRKPSGLLGWALGHLMAAEHRALTDWMFGFMGISKSDRLVDLGCGGGRSMLAAADVAPAGSVVGVDYSTTMVRQARARTRRLVQAGRAEVVHASVSSLPFANDTFDKAYSVETFYFWPAPLEDLREVCRVLRPGGVAAMVMDISKEGLDQERICDNASRLGISIYSCGELASLLEEAGFVEVMTHSVPEKAKGWICAVGKKPVV